MKTLKFLLLGFALILFSCSEDEEFQATSQGMLGTWNIATIDYSGTSVTTVQGQSLKSTFKGTGKDMDLISTFSENPNTVVTEGSYIIELETTTLGQTVTNDILFENVIVDGTWTLNGNTLTIDGAAGPQTATILEQTSTKLTMKLDVKQNLSNQGAVVSADIQVVYTFTKA